MRSIAGDKPACRSGRRGIGVRGAPRRSGSVLLEVVVAITVFIGASLAVMASVDRAVTALERTRGVQRAADLARTAMSQMEAGLATPVTLNGPLSVWQMGEPNAVPYSGGGGLGEWELEIQTEPSEFLGLTKVTVTALHHRAGGVSVDWSYTLRQLVSLSPSGSAQGEPR